MTNIINQKETEQKVQTSAQPNTCMYCGTSYDTEDSKYCYHCGQSFISPPQQRCECGRWKHSRQDYCGGCGKKNW